MNDYRVHLKVALQPQGQPQVRVRLGDQSRLQQIDQATVFAFDVVAQQSVILEIELLNKNDLDADTAVNIDSIEIFGISDPRFVWAGHYTPDYPEPWATQQRLAGHDLAPVLTNHTYLGWRGVWRLEISLPAFTWMHQTQGLGLIYE